MPAVTNYSVNVVDISERLLQAAALCLGSRSSRSTDFKQPEALRQAGTPLQVLGLDCSGRLLFG
ncbi:hypothetical protein RB213_012229 [Colletotrichum asianum]